MGWDRGDQEMKTKKEDESENIGQKSRQSEELHSARLCSHSQNGNSVSLQDGNSVLGSAFTRKSENSPSAEDYEK